MSTGQRVVVSELADDPMSAVERCMELVPMEEPPASELGPDDVVVGVKSASVSWVDLLMTSGQYQHLPQPPYTPGMEYAGVVLRKGAGASGGPAVGDSVLVDGLLAGPRSLGSYRRWGGFASYAVAPADAVLPLPAGLSFDQGCNLLGNYETAYHCLVTRGRLQRGETVLVLGASGGIGLATVQVAKLLGATVIAAGRSEAKLEVVRAEGADHTVCLRGEDALKGLRDQVRALVSGDGVDVVFDPVGGELSAAALRCVRFGGRYLIAGWAATPSVARGKGQRGAPNVNLLPTNLMMMKGLDVLGCPAAISALYDPLGRMERRATVLRWAAEGAVRPYVGRHYPLAEFREALRARWRAEVVGGCALRP